MVHIMDMEFEENSVPDFGTIRMIDAKPINIRTYILKSVDESKLSLITNAADGSKALCSDTDDCYIMHLGVWNKIKSSAADSSDTVENVNYQTLKTMIEAHTSNNEIHVTNELKELIYSLLEDNASDHSQITNEVAGISQTTEEKVLFKTKSNISEKYQIEKSYFIYSNNDYINDKNKDLLTFENIDGENVKYEELRISSYGQSVTTKIADVDLGVWGRCGAQIKAIEDKTVSVYSDSVYGKYSELSGE